MCTRKSWDLLSDEVMDLTSWSWKLSKWRRSENQHIEARSVSDAVDREGLPICWIVRGGFEFLQAHVQQRIYIGAPFVATTGWMQLELTIFCFLATLFRKLLKKRPRPGDRSRRPAWEGSLLWKITKKAVQRLLRVLTLTQKDINKPDL
jgi:hypothetical protein